MKIVKINKEDIDSSVTTSKPSNKLIMHSHGGDWYTWHHREHLREVKKARAQNAKSKKVRAQRAKNKSARKARKRK